MMTCVGSRRPNDSSFDSGSKDYLAVRHSGDNFVGMWTTIKKIIMDKIEQHKEVLYKAAAIKTQIKNLEEEYALIKPSLETAVIELTANAEKQEVNIPEIGKFCRTKGPTLWTYSLKTQDKQKELDQIKADEKANGDAVGVETFVIKFFGKKEDDNG